MTKHKHSEMIKAKADNMDLVLFGNEIGGEWRDCTFADLIIDTGFCDFFLCAPCNQEECLHWLNGGEVEYKDSNSNWSLLTENREWSRDSNFTSSYSYFRIKPKTEKKWIAIKCGLILGHGTYKSKSGAELACPLADQFIEIEIEVQ